MSLAQRIARATDGFRGGEGGTIVQQSIGSLFAGEVEILLVIDAELETEVEAEVVAEVTAEVEQVIDAEACP